MNIRLERGLRILVLLQTGAPYDAMKLAQELGVTRRTIFRDIAMLKDLGLIIDYDPLAGSYCVQVPRSLDHDGSGTTDASDSSTRSLNPMELARVLKPALDDDLSEPSSTAIIQQIAMNIARPKTWQSSEPRIRHTGQMDSVERFETESRIDEHRGTIAAPHISPTAGTLQFDRFVDQVGYLVNSIKTDAALQIWDRIEHVLYEIKPTELHFVNGIWTLTGVVDKDTVNLKLSCLDVVCEYQPS